MDQARWDNLVKEGVVQCKNAAAKLRDFLVTSVTNSHTKYASIVVVSTKNGGYGTSGVSFTASAVDSEGWTYYACITL